MAVSKSAFYYDDYDNLVLITQGLFGYTLVAQKKILFRFYVDPSSVWAAMALIKYQAGPATAQKTLIIPPEALFIETEAPLGPSVGIVLDGSVFPSAYGRYEVRFHLFGGDASRQQFKVKDLQFMPAGRLRLLIHNLVGLAPWGTTIQPDFSWLVEMFRSLQRFAAMLPVRDGIKLGLTHADAGICYLYGENIAAWPSVCPSGAPPPCSWDEMYEVNLAETKLINSSGTGEHVDATVSWRPRDLLRPGGEGVGGGAPYNQPESLAVIVGGNQGGKEYTAAIMAQEVGHLLGLEPEGSPHYQDPADEYHSRHPVLSDAYAFDFDLLKHYSPSPGGFLGDVMNNLGGGVSQGRDSVLYNAYDWEYLRQKLSVLRGASRSIDSEKRLTASQQAELLEEFEAAYSDEPTIALAAPEKSLGARRSWTWTSRGFGSAERTGADNEDRAARIIAFGEELGVKEAHAPIAGRPMGKAIRRPDYPDCHMSLPEFFARQNYSGP